VRTTILWVISSLLLLFAALIIVGNVRIILRWIFKREKSSTIPLVGGLCGVLGILLVPIRGAGKWWWVPLILDFNSIASLVGLILIFFKSPSQNS
jgi:hypothetical protein